MAYEEYNDNVDFAEFVLREAEDQMSNATTDELVEWAFGDMEAAVEAYKEHLAEKSEEDSHAD